MTVAQFPLHRRQPRWRWAPALLAGIVTVAALPGAGRTQTSNGGNESALTIRADTQRANSQTGVITAEGNVRIAYPARDIQATAAQAKYYRDKRRLVLSGGVYVLQEGNSLRAERVTYSVDRDRLVAESAQKQQVQATYVLPKQSQAQQ